MERTETLPSLMGTIPYALELIDFTKQIDVLMEINTTSIFIKHSGTLRMKHGLWDNAISPTSLLAV
jgi:hypothetical protein